MTYPFKFPLILLITALVSLWLGIQLAPSISTHSEPTTAQQSSVTASINSDAEELIATLQQRISLLENENNRLSSQLRKSPLDQNQPLVKVAPKTKPAETTADIKQLKEQIDFLQQEKQQRKADEIINWITDKQKSINNFDLNHELSRRFEQESINPIWAEKQENHYRQLFGSQDSLRNFALRDTQCRSTQCEVTFSISSPEQSVQLLQTISNEMPGTEILVATDATQGISKLYISGENGFELH